MSSTDRPLDLSRPVPLAELLGFHAGPRASGLAAGEIRLVWCRFTARPGERDAGRAGKRRPCLVCRIDGDEVEVAEIHRSGGFAGTAGGGVRLRGWRGAGLAKPSVVTPRRRWVPLRDVGRRIGRLDRDDFDRLLGARSEAEGER